MALEPSLVIVRAHDAPITSAAYCRPRLWTGCEGGLIKCWEEKTGTCVKILDGHGGGWVTDLLYSPSHRYLLSCGLDGGLTCWSDKGKVVQRAEQTTPLYCMAYGARNNQLAVGGHAVVHVFALRAVARSSSFVDDDAGARADAAVVHLTSVRDAHDDIVRAIRCDALGSGAFYTAGYDRAVCAFDPETLNPRPATSPTSAASPASAGFQTSTTPPSSPWTSTKTTDGSSPVRSTAPSACSPATRGDSTRSNPTGSRASSPSQDSPAPPRTSPPAWPKTVTKPAPSSRVSTRGRRWNSRNASRTRAGS